MRTYRAKSGPFTEMPYYTVEEIEQICGDELRKVDLFPADPMPIRVERFIEKRFNVHPLYEDLDEGLLGFTKFGPRGVEEIGVSKALAEEDNQICNRRISSTLAHEAGHGLFHGHLFALGRQNKSLFDGEFNLNERKILCRGKTIEGVQKGRIRYDGRWWEFQANRAIGGLLLPRPLVETALGKFMLEKGTLGNKILDPARREEAARFLSQVFDVNPIVARIRIGTIFSTGQESQLSL